MIVCCEAKQEYVTMKMNDPYARMQRQQLSSLSLTLPVMTLIVLIEVAILHNPLVIKGVFLILYALVLAAAAATVFRIRANLKQLEQKRERALRGDRSLLAREQPLANPNFLPLPTTIRLDKSRRVVVALGMMIALLIVIPFVIGLAIGLSQGYHNLANNALLLIVAVIFGGAVAALLLALALILFLLRSQLIFTIVVDERGISSTYQGVTSSINWSEARLFAVLSQERAATMRYYELSNGRTIVGWLDMPQYTLFRRMNNPANLEYRRKVQALLSYIVARTGLPLYDLSPSTDVMMWPRN